MNYYKVKADSEYGKGLEEARINQEKIADVSQQTRQEFSLPDSQFVSLNPITFYQPIETIPEHQNSQFKNDGFAKKNSKIHKRYIELIEENGLKDMKDARLINFIYGIMRRSQSETLRRYLFNGEYYIETNVDFSGNSNYLEEITEIEFHEIKLSVLKQTN